MEDEYFAVVKLSMLDAKAEFDRNWAQKTPISPQRKEEWKRYDKMFVERMESTDPVSREEEDRRLAEYAILTRDWDGTKYPRYPPDFDMAKLVVE
ncbi:hypothetical protein CAEBREN_24949 [Caenorhabditis brenneri]|uniref:Uncharacterized protein n=1 Tax=Caenorhabditis brenneri TaxID=135651 RepID=G0MYC0_CAEBE|nr:hypothetical protein CAEBREN_24949 [Caenorhabditis brenneri]